MMRPGDVVVYHRPTFSVMTALIHLSTRSRWNHVSIVAPLVEGSLLGDVFVFEATGAGVERNRLTSTTDEYRAIAVPYSDEEDRNSALAWAEARVGERYGYFNAFMCGLNGLLSGLGLAIKRTDAIICSELVAEALGHAGFDFKKDASQVSPGDVAEFLGVAR